jgi:GxxExxY protein
MPIVYDGHRFEEAFRADLIIGAKVIAELKSADAISPIHSTQVLTLRLSGLKLGLLINFGEAHLKDGIKRLVDGRLEEENPSGLSL